jgi:hypothetical protein
MARSLLQTLTREELDVIEYNLTAKAQIRPNVAKLVIESLEIFEDNRKGIFVDESKKYNFEKEVRAGAIGDGAQGQYSEGGGASSQKVVYAELQRLRTAAMAKAKTPEEFNDLAQIRQAEDAAEKGDEPAARSIMSKVGGWVRNLCVEIGAKAIAEWMKHPHL